MHNHHITVLAKNYMLSLHGEFHYRPHGEFGQLLEDWSVMAWLLVINFGISY